MHMRRLFIFCLLLTLTPICVHATEPSTVDEFAKALSPAKTTTVQEAIDPDIKKTRFKFRGVGGIQKIAAQPSATMHLTFAIDSAELSEQSKSALTNLGHALEKKTLRRYVYQLEGHTCDLGTAEHNMDLSRRRALSVRNYLANRCRLSRY
ncbi:hypothetical protein DSCO28_54330 [Desulfosarcina ovata subsp. sediminis]|uniref:OmpA-like domain-containing protein n=2 Tax=Desulfosarcina ovata TaxID=83564 RepID=A0A5K7ZX77_9BACT|nr:hypothetical protein DSCO28_54330 [Desulfosarcina ovata subsp. sediminis]